MSTIKVVQPSGILNGMKGNQFRREVSDVVAAGADIVLIDLQEVTFIDSSGLGALVSAMKIVRSAGGKLFICSVNDQVKMLFELTKMDRVFEIFDNQNEFNQKFLATK
ncbi:STAS domain-containing protein [Chroococcidiopsis sp. TS-821]|uniref:STAS domain-containing protein n=1 Tax=Chroococcidiopsis sp. TS-821 TaxID=1378066 RepID=UPI000CEE742A|nr:STAS domain-containing protein [Chroococcidiopsis sp. TS-821]PPS41429.1 sulfate transporter [Chroococcidiopsis sp. TS-821]